MQVSLQFYIVHCPEEPIIEILQFEKHQDRDRLSENSNDSDHENKDPYGNLLKWLIPLDNTTISQQYRSLPPPISSSSGTSSTLKPAISSASGSQLFSFCHSRSYSMSCLPPTTTPVTGPIKVQSSKPSFEASSNKWRVGELVRHISSMCSVAESLEPGSLQYVG